MSDVQARFGRRLRGTVWGGRRGKLVIARRSGCDWIPAVHRGTGGWPRPARGVDLDRDHVPLGGVMMPGVEIAGPMRDLHPLPLFTLQDKHVYFL